MSAIDDVIARSRQAGGFSKRKRFSIARTHAIQKMRRFALADPHYYILELIQSAVANGAKYIDINAGPKGMILSYVGGGYREEELSQLFDFLFAPKENLEHAAMRSLAIGINALLAMAPDEIVVESGDGSERGTTRIVIRGREDAVEVGRSERSLNGTYIKAVGLQRRKVAKQSALPVPASGAREVVAIEMRCMAAPVPFLINGDAVFGYATMRCPHLFGYRNCVTFDEGDLYGTIGTPGLSSDQASFKLLMSGVWIETVTQKIADVPIGGIVAFDRLRKTADHSGIVRDDVYEQLWVRLAPYVRRVVSGDRREATFSVSRLGESAQLTPKELREVLTSTNTAVIVPPATTADSRLGRLARQIARAVDTDVVLALPKEELAAVRALGGDRIRLIRPDETHPQELSFYQQPPAKEPPLPWLTSPVSPEPVAFDRVADALVRSGTLREHVDIVANKYGEAGDINVRIFTPADQKVGLRARVVTADRVVWEGALPTTHPGHYLDIRVPDVPPAPLSHEVAMSWPVAEGIARGVAIEVTDAIADASRRAIESLTGQEVEPGTTPARMVLAELAATTVKRVRGTPSRIELSVESDVRGVDLKHVPVLATLTGQPITIEDLEAMLEAQHGLVYGVVPEVPPNLAGLDTSKILSLDLESERDLIAIVGETGYVRVDGRDEIAGIGRVRCVDVAVGLTEYPDFPLLVTEAPPEPERADYVRALVQHLLRAVASDEDEEKRRQALRHLMWFLFEGMEDGEDHGAREAKIFVDESGNTFSFADIEKHERFRMADGRGLDAAAASARASASLEPNVATGAVHAMNPFVFGLLSRRGPVAGAVELDLSTLASSRPDAPVLLVSAPVEAEGLEGELGLPAEPVSDPAIVVIEPGYERVHLLRSLAREHHLVGEVRLKDQSVMERPDDLTVAIQLAARSTLRMLMAKLPDLDAEHREVALTALLDFAGRHTMISAVPDGTLAVRVYTTLAEHILELPLFLTDQTAPVSAKHLLETYARLFDGAADWRSYLRLSDRTPAYLLAWLDRELRVERVVMPASAPQVPAVAPAPKIAAVLDHATLVERLEHWLNALRIDDEDRTTIYFAEPGQLHLSPAGVPRLLRVGDDAPWNYQYKELPSELTVNANSPLVQWVLAAGAADPEPFAWLLLSAYAYMNDLLPRITNEHESAFMSSVAERLELSQPW